MGAAAQTRQAAPQERGDDQGFLGNVFGFLDFPFMQRRRGDVAFVHEIGPGHIGEQQRHHDGAVPGLDNAVPAQDGQQDDRQEHGRGVTADDARAAGQGGDNAADPQDKQNVRDIAANDIADSQIRLTRQGSLHGDHQFGRRGTEPDDSQADHGG
jgi:hypothetical protein